MICGNEISGQKIICHTLSYNVQSTKCYRKKISKVKEIREFYRWELLLYELVKKATVIM